MKDKLHLLLYFLKRDIRAKFAGSGLGIAWTILMPLFQIVLFWFVFSTILKSRPYSGTQVPYISFLLSTFFFWLSFSEGLLRSAHAVTDNADIVKKISFPVIILPVTVTLTSYILNIIGFFLFLAVHTATYGISPSLPLILPVLVFQVLFSLGCGLALSSLVPFVRDIGQILGQIMQGMFFLCPIIYSLDSIPEQFRVIFYLNPMTHFATSYHTIILLGQSPPPEVFLLLGILSCGCFAGGRFLFRRLRDGFPDVL